MTITDWIKREIPREVEFLNIEAARDQANEDALLIANGEIDVEAEDEQTRIDAEAADEEAFDLLIASEPRRSAFEDELDYLFGKPGSVREADSEPW